jgi:hypothetical protein
VDDDDDMSENEWECDSREVSASLLMLYPDKPE